MPIGPQTQKLARGSRVLAKIREGKTQQRMHAPLYGGEKHVHRDRVKYQTRAFDLVSSFWGQIQHLVGVVRELV